MPRPGPPPPIKSVRERFGAMRHVVPLFGLVWRTSRLLTLSTLARLLGHALVKLQLLNYVIFYSPSHRGRSRLGIRASSRWSIHACVGVRDSPTLRRRRSRGRVAVRSLREQTAAGYTLWEVPCPQGDPFLDNLTVRAFLKRLDSISSLSPPKEYKGFVYQDTLTGRHAFDIDDTTSANTCVKSGYTKTLPPGTRVFTSGHSHPYTVGNVTCTGGTYYGGLWGRLPSSLDWEVAYGTGQPGLIIDKGLIVRYLPPTNLDTVITKLPWATPPVDTLTGPPHNQINSLVNTVTRAGGGCAIL